MSRKKLADAFNALAEAAALLALELEAQDQPASEPVAGAGVGVPTGPAPTPDQTPNTALGMCPVHRTAWSVKEGGVSKNGKAYRAFWKCPVRDQDGFCEQKPDPAWIKTHNPERALVEAM